MSTAVRIVCANCASPNRPLYAQGRCSPCYQWIMRHPPDDGERPLSLDERPRRNPARVSPFGQALLEAMRNASSPS
jgi:hypothetical protein